MVVGMVVGIKHTDLWLGSYSIIVKFTIHILYYTFYYTMAIIFVRDHYVINMILIYTNTERIVLQVRER